MTVGVGGNAGTLDMRNLSLIDLYLGTVTQADSTSMTIYEGGGFTAHFEGIGVTYDASGNPAGGTITVISENYLDQTVFTLTDTNISATQFYQWVLTNDNATALSTIFGGNDSLSGTQFNDYLSGFSGHDVLSGGSGADTLIGGAGNDHLYGQSANGGPDGADSLSGGDGGDYLQGNAGDDTLDGGTGPDRINGGADNDRIYGGDGNDTVNGNLGSDTIDGGAGSDSLRGGQGDDRIDGGGGDDFISGDKGNDTVTGGAGSDIFYFAAGDAKIQGSSYDTITDYQIGTDHMSIGFSPVLIEGGSASTIYTALSAAQTLVEQHAGDHEVVAIEVGNDARLLWMSAGGTMIDSGIVLQGVDAGTITPADFI